MPQQSNAQERANLTWGMSSNYSLQPGNPFTPRTPVGEANPSGPGGPGNDLGARVGALERDMTTLRGWIGGTFALGLVGFISLFLLLDDRIDAGYTKAEGKIDRLIDVVWDIKTDNARNFERLSGQMAESAGAKGEKP